MNLYRISLLSAQRHKKSYVCGVKPTPGRKRVFPYILPLLSLALTLIHTDGILARKSLSESLEGGRLFGVFSGISNYRGNDMDLEGCVEDARNFQQAMLRSHNVKSSDSVLLIDAAATAQNFEQAILRFAGQMRENDLLVIFFSGHGGQQWRQAFQETDADYIDETLVLYDQEITDDRVKELLQSVHRGRILIVLDACYSGGFRKDLIDGPGRLGLFSSGELELSNIPANFVGGGYLARFITDSICYGPSCASLADADANGILTGQELVKYLKERYAHDVGKSDMASSRNGGPQYNHSDQHLICADDYISQDFALFKAGK